jgi:hypothetical protein
MSASIYASLRCKIAASTFVHNVTTEAEAKAVLANTLREIAARIETTNERSFSRELTDDLSNQPFGTVTLVISSRDLSL